MKLKEFKELIKKQYNDKGYHGLDFDTYSKEMWARCFKEFKELKRNNAQYNDETILDRVIYEEEDRFEMHWAIYGKEV